MAVQTCVGSFEHHQSFCRIHPACLAKMFLLDLPDAILLSIATQLLHRTESDIVVGLQDFERALHPMHQEIKFFESFVESLTLNNRVSESSHENSRVMLALATLSADTKSRLLDPFLIFSQSCSKLMDISLTLLGIPKQRCISLALSAMQKSRRDRNHHFHAAAWSLRHSCHTAFSSDVASMGSKRAVPAQLASKRNMTKESNLQMVSERNFIGSIDPTRRSVQSVAFCPSDSALDSFFSDVPSPISPSASLHEALDTSAFGSSFVLPDGVYDCRELVISRNNKLLPCSHHRVILGAGMMIDSVSATIQSCVFAGGRSDTLPLVVVESGSILFENCVFMEAKVAVRISNRNRLTRLGHAQPIVHFVNCVFHSCYTCLDSGDDRGFTGIMAVRCCKFMNCVNCITGTGASWVCKSVFENCSSAIHPGVDSKTILLDSTFTKCSYGILMDCDALMLVKDCVFVQCYSAGAHMQFDRASIIRSHFWECFIGVLISQSSKLRMAECKFSCCGLAGVQIIDKATPSLISCQSSGCFVGISVLDFAEPQINVCSGTNDSHSIHVYDHSSPRVIGLKVSYSKYGASMSSDSPRCFFSECIFEKCSTSAFSAHVSYVGVCENCHAHDCPTAFSAVVNSHGHFKQCKASSCHVAFQLEGHTRAERCVAIDSTCGFTGGGLSESALSHCQLCRCKVGIVVCGNMSVQFCKIQNCQEGIVCSGLEQSVVMNTQIDGCDTGLALLKLGSVYQCQITSSSLHGVRFDPACDVSLKSSSIKGCKVGVFNRSGGGSAHSCALKMCDVGILLEGEVLTCFERCVMDQNQKGCVMEGVLGNGTVKSCIFKRSRIFGLGLQGQGDPGFIISDNIFQENTTGIVYDCTSAPLLVRNTINKNLWSGVLFKPVSSVIFRQNRMIGNKGHGMQVMSNSSCVIEENVAERNEKFGVFFLTSQGANDLVFRKNVFNGNQGGGINVAPGSQGRITEW
jgi:hypothetical protein